MARVTSENYVTQLREKILPVLFDKINQCEDSEAITWGIVDLAKFYCNESNLSDDVNVPILDTLATGDFTFEDKDKNIASLLVLSCTYYLTAIDALKADEITLDNKSNLGFKDSVTMFKSSIENCEIERLSSIASLSDSDVKALIQQKLRLTIGSCTMEEYFKNHIYINDLNTILDTISPDDDETKKIIADMLAFSNTQINIAVRKIMNTYRSLFSSAYQVIKPVGLLTSDGIAYLDGDKICFSPSHESYQIYQYLVQLMDISESPSRDFNLNLIVSNFMDKRSNSKLYFSRKLIEFAFGCSSFSNDNDGNGIDIYPRASNIKSWDDYAENIVKPLVDLICKTTVIQLYSKKGYLADGGYKSTQAFELLKDVLDYLYKNLTSCILISNWKDVPDNAKDPNSSTSLVGFKIRVADVEHKIPLTTEVPKYIIDNIFGGLKGDTDAVCETVVPLGSNTDYSVCDIQHKFSPSLVNGEPLFAYTALRALQKADKRVSWDSNLVLGKRDDDSILTVGDGDVSFKKKLVHWVLAGSRSGKGVMTLNILAGAAASNKPIFYLDNKPDMASMFRSNDLSAGKMFCINGDYDASFDKTFNSCTPESFNWSKNIPPYLREALGNEYSAYAPIFYMRAVMFLTSLIFVRGSVRTDKELYNALGGKEGIVIVIDEISAADSAISAMLDKNGVLGSNFYSAPTLSEAEAKNNQNKLGQPIVTPFGCYSTDLIRSLNETFRTICGQWKLKGLTGGGTEGEVSDIFMIGQNIHEVDTSKMEYIPTNDNNMNRTSGDAFYNFLFNLGCDAFFGYNVDHPEYMWSSEEAASEGSKASTRLNATARNFAFVKQFDEGTVSTMLDSKLGGKSSKDISDNALYFKPFLIFNDAKEDSPYVADDFKRTCRLAGLDFEKVKNMHRRPDGVLEPEIGFIPYVKAQCDNMDSIQSVLYRSYDIANKLISAFLPSYDGSCIDFIYDLRPQAMFTAQSLLNAYRGGQSNETAKLFMKFYGTEDVQSVDSDGITSVDGTDFNDMTRIKELIQQPVNTQPTTSSVPFTSNSTNFDSTGGADNFFEQQHQRREEMRKHRGMEQTVENVMGGFANSQSSQSIEQQFRDIMHRIFIKHPDWRTIIVQEDREFIIQMCVSAYKNENGGV